MLSQYQAILAVVDPPENLERSAICEVSRHEFGVRTLQDLYPSLFYFVFPGRVVEDPHGLRERGGQAIQDALYRGEGQAVFFVLKDEVLKPAHLRWRQKKE